MKTFEAWMADGPLAGEFFTTEERRRMKIAYLEGAGAALEVSMARLDSLLPPESRPA